MSAEEQTLNPGLSSLGGYAYQLKVFIWQMISLQDGQQVEFETLDDVVVNHIAYKDSQEDWCVKKHSNAQSDITVFQVKQTKVTKAVGRKVLYNWLLALNENDNISKFSLYVDEQYTVDLSAFTNGFEKEYDHIVNSDKDTRALITKVKEIYAHDKVKFERDYKKIQDSYEQIFIKSIDDYIFEGVKSVFHSDAIGNVYYNKRIDELVVRVCSRILDSASRKIPYICTRKEYMQLCEEICNNISADEYRPNYMAFERTHGMEEISEQIISSREYQQLLACGLGEIDIKKHITWEQFYTHIRQHYLRESQSDHIDATESIAYQNHIDVVAELKLDSKDEPQRRLLKTKQRQISTLKDEYSKWGTYIYLTNEKSNRLISWKDDETNESK